MLHDPVKKVQLWVAYEPNIFSKELVLAKKKYYTYIS